MTCKIFQTSSASSQCQNSTKLLNCDSVKNSINSFIIPSTVFIIDFIPFKNIFWDSHFTNYNCGWFSAIDNYLPDAFIYRFKKSLHFTFTIEIVYPIKQKGSSGRTTFLSPIHRPRLSGSHSFKKSKKKKYPTLIPIEKPSFCLCFI